MRSPRPIRFRVGGREGRNLDLQKQEVYWYLGMKSLPPLQLRCLVSRAILIASQACLVNHEPSEASLELGAVWHSRTQKHTDLSHDPRPVSVQLNDLPLRLSHRRLSSRPKLLASGRLLRSSSRLTLAFDSLSSCQSVSNAHGAEKCCGDLLGTPSHASEAPAAVPRSGS